MFQSSGKVAQECMALHSPSYLTAICGPPKSQEEIELRRLHYWCQ